MCIRDRYTAITRAKKMVVIVGSQRTVETMVRNNRIIQRYSCLLYTSRVQHPKDVVSIGQTLDCVILKVDKENQRVSLGHKQLMPKPWDVASQKYIPGTVVTGKVVRIVSFGAFVELEPGLDGLVHISQICLLYTSRCV